MILKVDLWIFTNLCKMYHFLELLIYLLYHF